MRSRLEGGHRFNVYLYVVIQATRVQSTFVMVSDDIGSTTPGSELPQGFVQWRARREPRDAVGGVRIEHCIILHIVVQAHVLGGQGSSGGIGGIGTKVRIGF